MADCRSSKSVLRLQDQHAPLSLAAHGALSWFRTTLSCSSCRRFHQISLQGEVERPAGNDPASSRWRREALPLSYGRVVGRDRVELPQHRGGALQRLGFASTQPTHVGCGGPNRTAYLLVMSQASYRCSTPPQLMLGFPLHDGAPLHRRSRENWWKAEVLIPNGCPSIPLRTGARLLPG